MSTDLQEQFERLETQRKALLMRVEGLDEERLNRPPEPGKWSIIQVMCHLINAEETFLGGLRKEMRRASDRDKAGIMGALKRGLLKLAFRLPVRFKAPPRAKKPPERQSLATTRHQWDAVRAGWGETLATFPPELGDRGIFRHPVVGWLSLAQGLGFMEDHVSRHGKQIDRILAQSG